MGTLTEIRARMDVLDDRLYRKGQLHGERRKIREPAKVKMISTVELTEEQKNGIDRFFLTNLGKKIPYDWHRLYQSFTGIFRVDYFPEFLFGPELVPSWNPKAYRVFGDKNLLPVLTGGVPGLRTAEIYGSCANGIYRNRRGEVVSFEELKRELAEEIGNRKAVIKPTVGSSSGRDIRIADFEGGREKGTGLSVEGVLEGYKRNWNIQEFIRNSKELAELYPDSVNTFRTITFLWDGAVHFAPLILRIGRGGNHVDNAHANGLFVGCSYDGHLRQTGYSSVGERFDRHPDTGKAFAECYFPGVPKILECAKRMHERLPQMGVVFWDFTLDEDGNPVLVEINVNSLGCWLPQLANGEPFFGEYTAEILQYIKKSRK